MPDPSAIQVLCNDTIDITRYVVFARSRFDSQASSTPGTGTLVLKDSLRELDFTTGDEIAILVDGLKIWGGLVMAKSLGHFFPVVDTTDLEAVYDLMWTLELSDFNILMDKLVVRDTSNYKRVPWVGPGKLGQVIREAIANYMDVPPGLDYETNVEDTEFIWQDENGNSAPVPSDLGGTWRGALDKFAQQGAFDWRIDADKALHFHALRSLLSSWGFTDHHPNGVSSIGFREGTVREDGMQMVTDALVWGGHAYELEDRDAIVFARYPDPPAADLTANGVTYTREAEERALQRITDYGRWQRAELRIDEIGYFDQEGVNGRAAAIVVGPTGTITAQGSDMAGLDSGLNRPVWQVSLTWFAHDVPGMQHLVPGMIVPMTFWTMGDNGVPLSLWLPLRSLAVSFPTLPPRLPGEDPLTYVRFDGQFGISYSDSRYLWRFLRNRGDTPASNVLAIASNNTETTINGALGGFFPLEQPDGSRRDFTLPFSYQAGTTEVYLNALLQRPRYEYIESNPRTGKITFAVAPFADDTIWVVCRTGAT